MLSDARRLKESLSKIDPRTAAVLHFLLPLEPNAFRTNAAIDLSDRDRRLHDLALVMAPAVMDILVSSGRPTNYVRNSALMLMMRALEEATGERARFSRGTRASPQPHFTDRDGRLIRDLFAELGLPQESILAQAAERLRGTGKP